MMGSCTQPPERRGSGIPCPKIWCRAPLFHRSARSCNVERMKEPETLLLSGRDVRALLPMKECIEVMEGALRGVTDGTSVLPLRTVLRLEGTPNAFAAMPA